MTIIAVLKTVKEAPHQLPIRVKVVKVGKTKSYMKNETMGSWTDITLADTTDSINDICDD